MIAIRRVALALGIAVAFMPQAVLLAEESVAQVQVDRMERTRKLLVERQEEPKQPAAATEVEGLGGRMAKGLLLCLGMLGLAVFLLKKFHPAAAAQAGSRHMKLIERLSIGPRTALCLAEVDGTKVLFSVGSEQVTLISRLNEGTGFSDSLDELCSHEQSPPQRGLRS